MATLGSTAEPTTGQAFFGLNSTNHHAILLTMPAGGPWEISRLGAWLAGVNASAGYRLVVWSAAGSVLGQSALLSVAGQPFALGNNTKAEANLVTPVEVAGGQQVYVGFARDPADSVQFGTRSGSRLDKTSSSWPVSIAGGSSVSGAIGAWIADYHDANTAPNAPTGLSPTGSAVVNQGTAPTLSGTRSDPDTGDYITAYQIVVYADDAVTVRYDSGKVITSGTPSTFARPVALPAAHAHYRWKARTWDKKNVVGAYSAQQRFYANAVPQTPPLPTIETDSLSPRIDGSFTDSGDTLAAVQIEVQLNASPNTVKWASGDIAKSGASGSAWNQTYAGLVLAWGTAYRARYRVKDSNGAYSGWSAWRTFTPVQPIGPDNLTPRTTTPRLPNLTPTLTVGNNAAQFKNEEIEVYPVGSAVGYAPLWTKAAEGVDYALTNSVARVYAGTALNWGQRPWWRARVKLSDGTWTQWSPLFEIRINASPNVPSAMSPTGGVVLTDTTPQLRMNFSDPDQDQGDAPTQVTVEVRNNATDALVFSQSAVAVAPGVGEDGQSYDHLVSTTALANETTYKWRAVFYDATGKIGLFSTYQVFKVSQPPSATGVDPTLGETVTDSTPELDWTFSSPGGKAQHSYRVRVFDKGPVGANYPDEVVSYDSGELVGAATSHVLPHGALVSGHDYRWSVTVKDTDLLTYELA